MNIETGKTPTDQDYISFKNKYNEKITLVAGKESLRCALREDGDASMHAPHTHFTRNEVKAVLPYLQAYADKGTFEPQEPAVQSEREQALEELIALKDKIALEDELEIVKEASSEIRALETELATMQEAGIAMAANIADQGKRIEELQGDLAQAAGHIQDLEQLLREWKKYGQGLSGSKSPDELIDLTEQLLGEE